MMEADCWPRLHCREVRCSQLLRIRRRNAMPAILASTSEAASNPHGVSIGALAAALAHVPTCPARLQRINGSVQAVLQQTPLAQKPVPHCDGVAQEPPCGTGVAVGVLVIVGVAVRVAVLVTVAVCVAVAVWVGVLVTVAV